MNIKKIVLVAVLIIIAGFVFAYVYNLSKAPTKYFPNSIGAYSLIPVTGSKEMVEIKDSCNKIEDNPILKETGRTGNACMKIISATYGKVIASTTATTTSITQRVNLSLFTESADLLRLLVEKSTNPDTFEGKPVFRTAPFRLGWMPKSRFDMIIIDEGTLIVSSTTVIVKQEGQAMGDNDVFRHFISKYSPSK